MISKLSHVNLWVLDKDEAIAFYRDTLGFEVRQDMSLDGFRWVEVGPKGQPDVAFTLNEPSPPMMDEQSAAAIRSLLEKGAMSGGVFQTDDCRATFEELSARRSCRSRRSARTASRRCSATTGGTGSASRSRAARTADRHQRPNRTTSSIARRSGRAIGASGRSAG